MQMILVHRNINCVQWNATNYCLVDMLSVASFTLSKFTSSSPIDLSVHLLVYSSFKPVVTSYWLLHQSMSEISSLIHIRFAFARIFLNYPLAISKSSCWPQPTSVESLELSYNQPNHIQWHYAKSPFISDTFLCFEVLLHLKLI